MAFRFTKMHGIGNDYIYLDGFADARIGDLPAQKLRQLAIEMSDRHRGVGSDGLILVLPPRNLGAADVRMRMFNADGSESEMCGNGIRCVAKYAHDHGLTRARPIRVETGAGLLSIDYALDRDGKVTSATVDMGAPILDLTRIPVDAARLAWSRPPLHGLQLRSPAERGAGGEAGGEETQRGTGDWIATFVSMGNPHAVLFDAENPPLASIDLNSFELDRLGPLVEHHPAFPRRINVHIVQVISRNEVRMRTWERGAGVTMACGTGACAVCVAGVLCGRTDHEILAHLPGGDLTLRWNGRPEDHVFMTGPAEEIFSGEWDFRGE